MHIVSELLLAVSNFFLSNGDSIPQNKKSVLNVLSMNFEEITFFSLATLVLPGEYLLNPPGSLQEKHLIREKCSILLRPRETKVFGSIFDMDICI